MCKSSSKIAMLTSVFITAMPLTVQGQDDSSEAVEVPIHDDNTERCIPVRSIRRTEIIDDRNILFHMRNKIVYHNVLSNRCAGLAREDRFSYTTTGGRLCNSDSITVVSQGSFGARNGSFCRLNQFYKMTREDAEAFKEDANELPPTNPLPMPVPQEVGADESNSE